MQDSISTSPIADVSALTDRYWQTGQIDRQAVHRLARSALADSVAASEATQILFGEIIEPLCDSFSLSDARAYTEVFAEIVRVVRRGENVDGLIRDLDGVGAAPAACRARGLRVIEASPPPTVGNATRFFVLSRITLGADVAVVTPIIAALLDRNPDARVTFIGPKPSAGLVRGEPRVTFRAVDYPRRGGLLARFGGWQAALRVVREETGGLAPSQWLVIDPDSRLTQLGLLPMASDEQTRFFPSRTYQMPGVQRLGALAGSWAAELTRRDEPRLPQVWITAEARALAAQLIARLRPHAWRWAVVNFGVGGNDRKGLGADFEEQLLRRLLDTGIGVLLSRGVSHPEREAVARLVGRVAAAGVDIVHLPAIGAEEALTGPGRRELVTWEADTEGMAALVSATDLHVGYDSAGQHVAAAVGTPGITIFRPIAGDRHFERWSPYGAGPTCVLRVDPATVDLSDVIRQVVTSAGHPVPT